MQATTRSEVTYAIESLSRFISEAFPLLNDHWQEIAHYRDIPLRPDTARYHTLEDGGMLRIYTARLDGVLIGYSVFIVSRHAHYTDSVHALQDVLFVHPDHRRGRLGIQLVDFSEDQLRAEGVQVVVHHVKVRHLALAAILERRKYELVEVNYVKRLDTDEPRPTSSLSTLVDDVMTFFRMRAKQWR